MLKPSKKRLMLWNRNASQRVITWHHFGDNRGSTNMRDQFRSPSDGAAPQKIDLNVSALDNDEMAAYIADVADGLSRLAKRADLGFLAYLLDMVVTEGTKQNPH